MTDKQATAIAMFGNGCFWCTEAMFQHVDGVLKVTSGYSGGAVKNPTYKQVCSGKTGHAEVVRIEYDPATVTYEELLDVFFATHDPTTLNRQGADVGTQYRSAVFTFDDAQERAAIAAIKALNESGKHRRPVVTEVTKAGPFYPAEDYHQDYFSNNSNAPYCRLVIAPKLEKFKKTRTPD